MAGICQQGDEGCVATCHGSVVLQLTETLHISPAVAPLVNPIAVHQAVNVLPLEAVAIGILKHALAVALSLLHEAFIPDGAKMNTP
eukprot:8365713-Pyramimonas_sp.AAC.2